MSFSDQSILQNHALFTVTSEHLNSLHSAFRCNLNSGTPVIWIISLYLWYQAYFMIIILKFWVTVLSFTYLKNIFYGCKNRLIVCFQFGHGPSLGWYCWPVKRWISLNHWLYCFEVKRSQIFKTCFYFGMELPLGWTDEQWKDGFGWIILNVVFQGK